MNTTARSILSAITASGLTAFALISIFSSGVSAPVTALAVGLLVVYGLLQMAFLSYAPRRTIRRRAPALRVVPQRAMVRVPALVEYSSRSVHARAA